MLVLTRKIQESVVVGGADRFQRIMKIKVLEIAGERVKLGFDVDADVPVHRLEVWERINGNGRIAGPTAVSERPATDAGSADGANATPST